MLVPLLEPEPELHEKIAAHGNISLEIPALSDALEQTWKQYSPEVCADAMIAAIVRHSEALAAQTVHQPEQTDAADRRLDRILAGKPMVISTNLNIDEAARRYSPQIASRLQGSFQGLTFVGEDIRILKNRGL